MRYAMKRPPFSLNIALIILISLSLLAAPGCGKKERPTFDAQYDVIIVGGGMAGLSAGAHLASKGLKVLLLEQHHKVGGCTTSFKRGPFTFEVALHELAGGGLFQLLDACGVKDKVKLYPLPELYRSIFPGDPPIDVTMTPDWDEWDATLKEKWPEESAGVDKLHKLSTEVFADVMDVKDLFRYSGAKALFKTLSVPIKHPALVKWSKRTFQELLDECFTGDDIKAVVSQFWIYYGAPVPDEVAILSLAANEVFLTDGAWHVKGTSEALATAYADRIRELGGEVKTGTLVTKVIIKDGLARGVETEFGDTYTSRYVVCNTDPYQLIYTLVGEENLPKSYVQKVKELKPANSLFVTYLGLNIDLAAKGYTDTEIFYNTSKDTVAMYDNMMKNNFKDGLLSITIYSNYGDPIYAPPGKSVVALLEFSDYDAWPKDPDEYRKMKEEKAKEVIDLAAKVIPELGDPRNIEVMEAMTPVTLAEFTMNYHGIPYGFYLDTKQWKKVPVNTPIDNLFIASSWTQAWHGVGSAQINGWMAARLIMDREGIE
jgi:phytoene dehydrogenase-like protein